MEAAFAAQAAGEADADNAESGYMEGHREWIRMLLTEYYDPMYEYQMAQRDGERLFRGSRAALVAHAREQCASA
jgi:tRNA 2-selenouridine synthase